MMRSIVLAVLICLGFQWDCHGQFFFTPKKDDLHRNPPAVNAPPAAAAVGGALSYTENDPGVVISSTITLDDPENDQITEATIQVVVGHQSGSDLIEYPSQIGSITGSWTQATGIMLLSGSDTEANYQTALRSLTYSNFEDNPLTTKTIRFSARDAGGYGNTVTKDVTVTAVNDAPTVAQIEATAMAFMEGDLPKAISATITVDDVDDTMIESASVQITTGYNSGEDEITFPGVAGIGGVWNSGTGEMSLSGTDTVDNYQQALRECKYSNDGSPIDTTQRVVTFKVNDGDVDSNSITRTIDVTGEDLVATTGDNFSVEYNATGGVVAIKDGATTLTKHATELGGFYVKDFTSRTNLLTNGDFETGDLTGWTVSGDATIQTEGANDYVQLDATAGGVTIEQNPAVTPGHTYGFRGKFRSNGGGNVKWLNGVPTGWQFWQISGNSRAQVASQYQFLVFPANTASWTEFYLVPNGQTAVYADVGATNFNFELKIIGTGATTVDFDDVEMFDIDEKGTRLTHTVTAGTGGDVEFTATGQNTTLTATISEKSNHLLVDGHIIGDTTDERILAVDFCLPIDPTGWTWADNIDDERAYDAVTQFINYETNPVIEFTDYQIVTHQTSSINDGTRGLSIGQDIREPRLYKLFFRDDGLWIRYHFGLNNTTVPAKRADFTFALYKHADTSYPMRAALAKHAQIWPTLYTDFMTAANGFKHGATVFNMPVVSDPYDFGVSADLRGWFTARPTLQDAGVALTTQGMGVEWHLQATPSSDDNTQQNMEDLLSTTKAGMESSSSYFWSVTGDTYTHRYGASSTYEVERQRFWNCRVIDLFGNFPLKDFTSVTRVLGTSAGRSLPSPNMSEGEWEFYHQASINTATANSRDWLGAQSDNVGLAAGRTLWNFNTALYPYLQYPLTWEPTSVQVCSLQPFTYFEHLKWLRDTCHARSPLAISVGNNERSQRATQLYLAVMDRVGGESYPEDLIFQETQRDKRAVVGKDICLNGILNSKTYSSADLDEVFSLAYLYNFWPAMLGLNYVNADFSEADRTDLQAFFPLLVTLDAAGWEYLPHVTGDAGMLCERFGDFSTGDLHITIHNDTDSEITNGNVTVDTSALGIGGLTNWTDLYNDHTSDQDQTDVNTTFTVTIPARRSVVYQVDAAGGVEPDDQAGLVWWMRADTSVSPGTDGQPVDSWTSKEGSSFAFTAATTKRPIHRASGIGGQPGLEFDGVNDILVYAGSFNEPDGELWVVARPKYVSATRTAVGTGDEGGTNASAVLYLPVLATQTFGFGESGANFCRGSTTLAVDTDYLFRVVSTGSSWSNLEVSGTAESITYNASDTGQWFDVAAADNVTIGGRKRTSEDSFSQIIVSEIFLYDSARTASQVQQLEDYVETRYGITIP